MTFYLLSNKRRPELLPRLTSFLLHRFDLNEGIAAGLQAPQSVSPAVRRPIHICDQLLQRPRSTVRDRAAVEYSSSRVNLQFFDPDTDLGLRRMFLTHPALSPVSANK
jgi:hypothetical protein